MKMSFMMDHPRPRAACGYPVHELPSDLPATILIDLISENEKQIYYGSSPCNIFETQNLPLINSSPPIKLLVDPKAKQVAVH